MARGINKVILVGNVGKDPETRYSAGGMAVTTVSVATSEAWKDKQSGEQKEKTEWHRVKFFGRLAEIAGEYLKKGSQVYIEGSLRTEEYEKDGVKRYSTDIVAQEMQMLGGRTEGGERQAQGKPAQGDMVRHRAPEQQQAQEPTQRAAGGALDDDDIPFRQHCHRQHF